MICCDPYVNFGMPALKGRRLTVFDIVTKIYYEKSINTALVDYEISLEDARDATNYCMQLKCKEDKDLVHFCDGCMLRTLQDGWNFNREDYIEFKGAKQTFVVSKDNAVFFAGNLQELENSEFGKATWLIAEEASKRL